jgi:thymidine kinase
MIHVFTGPMFASKTTRLLSCIERESYRARCRDAILLVKHSIDGRHGDRIVGTHHGLVRHATVTTDVLDKVNRGDLEGVEAICVDEGQFFPDLDEACLAWKDAGIKVYVACLDLDSERRPWDNVAKLLCHADIVEKCQAVCECKRDATVTFRQDAQTSRIVVGDADRYTSLCNQCYLGRRGGGMKLD